MQEYVKRLWAAFNGLTEESLPLLGRREPREPEDLEAFAQGGSERVVVVCEVCEPAARASEMFTSASEKGDSV